MPIQVTDTLRDPIADDERQYLWTLNFGPQHPATHTTLRLILKLDGERVVDAYPDIGFMHSGFEKLGEHLNYNQYVTVVDRMNYISPTSNEVAWHGAVEKLLGIELTRRAKYIRVIINELGRISDHLLCTGAAALDLGAFTAFLYAFYERERLYDIFETMAGQRMHTSYTRVGGVMYDFSGPTIQMIRDFDATFPNTLADMHKLLTRNRIFVDRTKAIGVLSKDDAINWGVTGPLARASGVTRDLRKDEPYLAYADFDFQVPVSTGGDCYERFLIRMAEMEESIKIVRQAIENLPPGPVNVDLNSKVGLPDKTQVYTSMESLIHHFEMVMWNRGFQAPVDEVYGANETANGELGYYIVSDGSDTAWRARTRPPSFIHFAIFPSLIRGHQVSDVVAVLGSLNIIVAELDR